mgnify:CR=1 FL=1
MIIVFFWGWKYLSNKVGVTNMGFDHVRSVENDVFNVGCPRIDTVSSLSSTFGYEIAIVNFKGQTKALFHFFLPLAEFQPYEG